MAIFSIAAAFLISSSLAGFWYKTGIFDSVKFEKTDLIRSSPESHLYVLMCLCRSSDVNKHMKRLSKFIRGAIDSTEKGPPLLESAARLYGSPEGATSLSCSIFFDNPSELDPRWAIGWVVNTSTFEEAQEFAAEVANGIQGEEVIRAVRLGPGPIIKGSFPWRHRFTPVIAPMFHWQEAFKTYIQLGETSSCGREDEEGSIACELYVTGKNDSRVRIDYIILMGNTTATWDDIAPPIFLE